MPFIAAEQMNILKNRMQTPNLTFILEDRGNSAVRDMPGSYTTARSKVQMFYLFRNQYMKKGMVKFSEDFLVANREFASLPPDKVKDEFVAEMRKFAQKRITRRNNRDGGYDEIEFAYSGKVAGVNDDFVMALMIGVLSYQQFLSPSNRDKYGKYW